MPESKCAKQTKLFFLMNRLPTKLKLKGGRRKKRTARVEFPNGTKFYATATDFWGWVRRGFVRHVSDNPLVGEVANETEFRLILVGHTVFNPNEREHLSEVMHAKKHFKRKKGFS